MTGKKASGNASSFDRKTLQAGSGSPSRDPGWTDARNKAIARFLDRFADSPDRDVLAEILIAVTRLAREKADRGDLKLLATTVKELRYAFKVFAPYSRIRKVSIFGSSRTPDGHPDYVLADAFARLMRRKRWMVITGAGGGIMGAGQAGAGRSASFGVAIRLPHEQKTNPVILDDPKLINFKYFFTRKILFLKEASAVCLFPGGFGTHDEGFEALTLIQTGKAPLIPVVFLDSPGGTSWRSLQTYIRTELLAKGMIGEDDMRLFKFTDDIQAAVDEITGFYRRYHSMRFVGEALVLRLNSSLPAAGIERLNDAYGGILAGGRIEQHPGPVEEEDIEYPDLPRLTLRFDRRSYGRLRMLIDDINRSKRARA